MRNDYWIFFWFVGLHCVCLASILFVYYRIWYVCVCVCVKKIHLYFLAVVRWWGRLVMAHVRTMHMLDRHHFPAMVLCLKTPEFSPAIVAQTHLGHCFDQATCNGPADHEMYLVLLLGRATAGKERKRKNVYKSVKLAMRIRFYLLLCHSWLFSSAEIQLCVYASACRRVWPHSENYLKAFAVMLFNC